MKARVLSELGADMTQAATPQELVSYSKKAIDMCPFDAENDPAFPYTYTTPYILYLNQEIAYNGMSMHNDAWLALEHAEKYVDAIPTTRRLELLTHQAITAIHLGNLELATSKLEEAISISKTVDTKLWHSTIEENIQQLQTKWGNEPIVKNTIQMLKER